MRGFRMPMAREGTSNKQRGAIGAAEADRPPTGVVWREARDLMWTYRRRIAVGLALIFVGRLASMVLPAAPKVLIDEVVGKGRDDLLVWLALAVAGASLVQALASFSLSVLLSVTAQRAITEMRKKVQRHVTLLPVFRFDATQTGQLISRIMTDAEGVRNLVGTGLVQLVGGLFTSAVALVVLFYLNWTLTLFTLGALVVFGLVMAGAFRRLRPIFRERGRINAEVTGRLTESLGGIRVVKAYTAERREHRVFARGVHRLLRLVARSILGISGVTAFSTVVIGAVSVMLILAGGRAVVSGGMSLGDFITYIFFTGIMASPIIQMAAIGTQISEAFAGLDRIREVLGTPVEEDVTGSEPLGEVKGDIAFETVHFEYEEGVEVLKEVSFEAPAGSTTALVGSSGSGKSTLIGLVMAFYPPKSGTVSLDGRDLASVRLKEYRSLLGVVLQDNFLFDGTIAENIRFSRPDASDEDVRDVGRLAHCDEFVDGFDKGYDTLVGERGVRLSGGQRQRVAIARALLARPKILILDEATSNLDSESEAYIQDGLNNLRQGRTTFVIAHRLSTIRSADQILVLEEGRIVERGSHDELIAMEGRYKELHDRQTALDANRYLNPGEVYSRGD